jgi:hypothetical protein
MVVAPSAAKGRDLFGLEGFLWQRPVGRGWGDAHELCLGIVTERRVLLLEIEDARKGARFDLVVLVTISPRHLTHEIGCCRHSAPTVVCQNLVR